MDGGSSVNIMYEHYFKQLPDNVRKKIRPATATLSGFSFESSIPEGVIHLETTLGVDPLSRIIIMEFSRHKIEFQV